MFRGMECGIGGKAIMRLPRLRVRTYLLLVGVVAVLAWASLMGLRWYEYYRRARHYSFQERHYRERAQSDLAQGKTRTIEARWGLQLADYYAPLVRKYRRAMWRPWVSIEFEPTFRWLDDESGQLQETWEDPRLRAPVPRPRRPTPPPSQLPERPQGGL
jgi:hypothetical protein